MESTQSDTRSRYFPPRLQVGRVEVTPGDIVTALACLRAAPGLMIRQPLAAIGSPLAACAYHEVAAPWRHRFTAIAARGRGAAGRPIAREAFCAALEEILEAASTERGMRRLHADAMAAFSADHAYAAAIARAAVALATKRHTAALRTALRQAAHQAVSQCDIAAGAFRCENASPCGTGGCRFAQGDLALLAIPSPRGKHKRPANHTAGGGFTPEDTLAAYAALRPFAVGIPVRDADTATSADTHI